MLPHGYFIYVVDLLTRIRKFFRNYC